MIPGTLFINSNFICIGKEIIEPMPNTINKTSFTYLLPFKIIFKYSDSE